MQDRSEWQGFVRGNALGIAQGMKARPSREATVLGCHIYMKPVGANLSVDKPTT